MSLGASWQRCPERLRKFIHFVAIGCINTCFGYLIYAAMVFAGFRPPIALLIAMVIGPIFNFFSFGQVVFKHLAWKRVPQFILAYIVNYLGNVFLLGKVQKMVPSPYLAQLLILPLSMLFMFFVLGRFVFNRRV